MTAGLTCGVDVRETERVPLKLAEGAEAKAGMFPVRVTGHEENADKSPIRFGGDEVKFDGKPPAATVCLEFTEEKRRWVKTAKFFDADGEIPSQLVATDSQDKGDAIVTSNSAALARNSKDITLLLVYYDRIEEVEVPISIDTGLGF